jgi:hypothetical protein
MRHSAQLRINKIGEQIKRCAIARLHTAKKHGHIWWFLIRHDLNNSFYRRPAGA